MFIRPRGCHFALLGALCTHGTLTVHGAVHLSRFAASDLGLSSWAYAADFGVVR